MNNLYSRIMLLIVLVVFIVLLYLCNTMVEPILSLETRAKYTTGDVTTMVSDIKQISSTRDIIFFISLFGTIVCSILFILSYAIPWVKLQKNKEPKETKIKESNINKYKKK